MKRLFFCFVFLLCSVYARATHIVGGEFELIHLERNRYLLRLIEYFDDVNGNSSIVFGDGVNPAETNINVAIFSNFDNRRIQSVNLNRVSFNELVPYTNMECAIGELVTRRIVFERSITLDPDVYNEEEGYYIAWERCCRNGTINNIISPDESGQAFLLEFPPVVKDGQPFINSSPSIFPPLSDFACAGQLYFSDFAGQDADGDSLVYSMSLPLNGNADQTAPAPPVSPKPYPVVNFVSGVGLNNQVPGNPSLSISNDGLLTVVPSQTSVGLNVFAVKVEEFRDGVKIGEVRRDFQLLVLDCPPPGVKPEIEAETASGSLIDDNAVLFFGVEDEKCFNLLLSDETSGEIVSVRARPVNFTGQIDDIFSVVREAVPENGEPLEIEVCLPDCPFTDGIATIDFIAMDNSCPLPLQDTIRLSFDIEAPPNQAPFWNEGTNRIIQTRREGESFNITLDGVDPDDDSLTVRLVTDGFDPDDFGIQLDTIKNEAGELDVQLIWDTDCQVFDFTQRNSFNLQFFLEDLDQCLVDNEAFIELDLEVILPPNTIPDISTSIDISNPIDLVAENTLVFDVFGSDADNDVITLTGTPLNFDFNVFNAVFENQQAVGSTQSPFSLTGNCNLLDNNPLLVSFKVEDQDKCKFPNNDSLILELNIVPPPNDAPVISFSEEALRVSIIAGEEFNLGVFGNDINNDSLSLILRRTTGFGDRTPFTFKNASGVGEVESDLVWQTGCEDLGEGFSPQSYSFSFMLDEGACGPDLSDILAIEVEVVDREQNFDIDTLYNVFTPNFDGKNDTFYFEELPVDGCANSFERITIVDRWGRTVFESEDRNFEWDGAISPTGVYFYNLEFTNDDFTSWLHLLR